MNLRLAAGVTRDFYEASTPEERFGAAILCPVYFVCCLLTRVPRQRESGPVLGMELGLQSASIFKGAGHGDLVGVLDVGARRDAGGDARDAKFGKAGMSFVG